MGRLIVYGPRKSPTIDSPTGVPEGKKVCFGSAVHGPATAAKEAHRRPDNAWVNPVQFSSMTLLQPGNV
jgi:hypothetical protein